MSVSDTDPVRNSSLREPLEQAWPEVRAKRAGDGNGGAPLGATELIKFWKDGKGLCRHQSYDSQERKSFSPWSSALLSRNGVALNCASAVELVNVLLIFTSNLRLYNLPTSTPGHLRLGFGARW